MIFTGVNHVCIATHDLDRAIRAWSDKYGVGPWRVYSYDPSNMSAMVDGQPTEFEMRVGLCHVGPAFRVEIIQPLDDRSPYARSLAQHGGADHVHHIRFEVEDYDSAVDRLGELGLETVLDATFGNGVTATYFSTEDELGFTLEVARIPPGFSMPDPELVYPP